MTACPTDSLIERYAAGGLSASQINDIDRHAEQCLTCAEKLAGAAGFEEVLTGVRQACQDGQNPAADIERTEPLTQDGDLLLNQVIGDFEVRRLIGSGGMGAVYEAEQISLKRRVALKVMHSPVAARTAGALRFAREARAAARLHHTNIVSVFAQGQTAGLRYYAMEMIDGSGLDQIIRETRRERDEGHAEGPYGSLRRRTVGRRGQESRSSRSGPAAGAESDVRTRLVRLDRIDPGRRFDLVARLVADVADALDYAHRQGVIHRDVKPSNLILSADGRLSLTDFGLARVLEQPGMTIAGEFLGSPLYMSPEQVAAGRVPVDHRTDIYSLGAALYELLCLEPPYSGETREQVISQIREGRLRRPRQVDGRIPRDLETVCLKAMRPDPVHRYATAGEMADDLRRFVRRFAIQARRATLVGRAVKFVRRHSLEMTMLAGVLAVIVGAGLVALHYRRLNNWAKDELALSKGVTQELWRRWDSVRWAQALDRGHLAVANCRFTEARNAFDEAIRLVERDSMGHLAGDPAGHLARGLLGFLTELIGINPGRSGFTQDLEAALALRPKSDLLDLLSKLPDPVTVGSASSKALASLAVRVPEISDGSIRRLTHDHGGLVYMALAWVMLAGNDPDRALALSDEALAAQPNLAVAYFLRAKILLAKGQPDEAAGELRLATRLVSHRRLRDGVETARDDLVRSIMAFVLSRGDEAVRPIRPATRPSPGGRGDRRAQVERPGRNWSSVPAGEQP